MRNDTVLARLILSVREGEIVSRQEIFSRAGASDPNYLRLLIQGDYFRPNGAGLEITPAGLQRQIFYQRPQL